jgi:uncharacterized protein DUF4382
VGRRLIDMRTIFISLSLLALIGCGGSGGTGVLSLGLTDATSNAFSAVYVTIDEIRVHQNQDAAESDMGWVTIPMQNPGRTYNLLDLANGLVEGLGNGPLAAGSYSQIRLIIDPNTPDDRPNIQCNHHPFANYVIDADDGEVHEIKVPSGPETGIKIVCAGLCNIAPNQTTELILDFDAAASVTPSFNLQPTIKVLSTADFSIVMGTVTDTANPPAFLGAEVSAQIFNPGALDPKDRVVVHASTLADLNGQYELFLRPGSYNLVAFDEGFGPGVAAFTGLPGQVAIQDFALAPSDMGTLGGMVSIPSQDMDTFAHLSFQQAALGGTTEIEVANRDVLNGGSYLVNLPVGNYDAVGSTCDLPTQVVPNLAIGAGANPPLDFTF